MRWLADGSTAALAEALDRVMAWHVRTALGDVLWRTEAGIPLADHRTPSDWVHDLSARLDQLGII